LHAAGRGDKFISGTNLRNYVEGQFKLSQKGNLVPSLQEKHVAFGRAKKETRLYLSDRKVRYLLMTRLCASSWQKFHRILCVT
jgi:hypothetical protein